MAQLFTTPFQTTLDANANAISGAQLRFYVSGTNTAAPVYADAALTTPLATPVVADSAGRFVPIYLNPQITYRVVVADAGGTPIRDVDPISNSDLADLADGGGLALVGFTQGDIGAVDRTALDKAKEAPRSPEDYSNIQSAINAAKAAGVHATVQLRQNTVYNITTGIQVDSTRASLMGDATIVALVPAGTAAITIGSSVTGLPSQTSGAESSASYGHKGVLSGFRLSGHATDVGAITNGRIGIDFNGAVENGSAQMDLDCGALYGFEVGVRFSNYAYNSTFYRHEIFNCGTCVEWPEGVDNNERNTFISPTHYNSGWDYVVTSPASEIFAMGGSSDFNEGIAKVVGGKIFLTDMHMESNRWEQYPFQATGDGGLISVKGGVLLNQNPAMPSSYLAFVGPGAKIEFDGTFIHNLTLTRESADSPTAFFNGGGVGVIRNTWGFDGSLIPDRLNPNFTSLNDPSFEADTWNDLVWIAADTAPPTSRTVGTNLTATKVTAGRRSGTKALAMNKGPAGGGVEASLGIIRLPVVPGDKVMAGVHYRNAAASGSLTCSVLWRWARFDRYDANGLPIWFWTADAMGGYNSGLGEPLTATQDYQMHVYGKIPGTSAIRIGLATRTAPPGATDFIAIIRGNGMTENSTLLLDDIWADPW